MEGNKRIGIDVGGSHVSAGVIDIRNPGKHPLYLLRKDINANSTAYNK